MLSVNMNFPSITPKKQYSFRTCLIENQLTLYQTRIYPSRK